MRILYNFEPEMLKRFIREGLEKEHPGAIVFYVSVEPVEDEEGYQIEDNFEIWADVIDEPILQGDLR